MAMYRQAGKRLCDVVAGTLLMIGAAPVLVGAALAVRFALGRPVFWRQRRPGLNGQPFWMIKLRTMTTATDPLGHLLPDEQRMTRIGRLLRNSSIDELPELWNVVKGDMSLVGPRPLLMQYLERYTPEQARRHEVRPGITGLAQVSGRNALSWDEKFALDVRYVDTLSPWLDARLLILTVWNVLSRDGISQPGQATAQEFMGSASR
jgi:lipopolysaccharide/colanic/teichoic acid biosynthesis glycosyltransferase